jgi:hypothetical protein
MTSKYFHSNQGLFTINGFEYEDILSIVTIFALTFWGMPCGANDERGKYLLMMRFISQRMHNFVNWVAKKFHVNDVNITYTGDYEQLHSHMADKNTIEINGIPMWGLIREPSLSDRIKQLYDQVDEIDRQIEKSHDNKLIQQRKAVFRQLMAARRTYRDKYYQKEPLQKMRNELDRNPAKYADQLSYYATTKHVSADVRKAARLTCKRYGINYVEWAKSKINQDYANINEFTF